LFDGRIGRVHAMDRDQKVFYTGRDLKQAPPALESLRRMGCSITRRGSRVLIGSEAPVQLQLSAASLINISLSGALVEHTRRLRVGDVYRLSFPIQGLQVEVLAWAVRSFVSHVIPGNGGDGRIVYRTGLEFVALEDGVRRVLSGYLQHLRRQAQSKSK
jgi:hypothetical protein